MLHHGLGPPTGIRETRGERIISVLAVPETASGAQGEKPLVKWLNVGKGSRQNRFVSSREKLALKAGRVRVGSGGVRGPACTRGGWGD